MSVWQNETDTIMVNNEAPPSTRPTTRSSCTAAWDWSWPSSSSAASASARTTGRERALRASAPLTGAAPAYSGDETTTVGTTTTIEKRGRWPRRARGPERLEFPTRRTSPRNRKGCSEWRRGSRQTSRCPPSRSSSSDAVCHGVPDVLDEVHLLGRVANRAAKVLPFANPAPCAFFKDS